MVACLCAAMERVRAAHAVSAGQAFVGSLPAVGSANLDGVDPPQNHLSTVAAETEGANSPTSPVSASTTPVEPPIENGTADAAPSHGGETDQRKRGTHYGLCRAEANANFSALIAAETHENVFQ